MIALRVHGQAAGEPDRDTGLIHPSFKTLAHDRAAACVHSRASTVTVERRGPAGGRGGHGQSLRRSDESDGVPPGGQWQSPVARDPGSVRT